MSWHVQYRFKLKQNLDANGYQRLQKHNEKWSDEVSEFSGGYGLHGNVGDSELRGSSQPSGDFHWASDALTIVRALVDLETKLDGKAYVQDPTGNSAKWLSVRKIDQPKLSKRLLETLSHVDIGDDEEGDEDVEFELDSESDTAVELPDHVQPPDDPVEEALKQAQEDFERWKNRHRPAH